MELRRSSKAPRARIASNELAELSQSLAFVFGIDQHLKAPPVTKNTTPALTAKQAITVLEAVPTETLKGLRDFALLETFFITGCRVSAIVGACVGHLEFDGVEYYLNVTEKRNKKGRKILLDAARPVLAYIEAAKIGQDLEL